MTAGLRLVGDDLTGTLDAAAPFATAQAAVAVLRDPRLAEAHAGAWALDAATRAGSADTARQAALHAGALMQGAGLALRKIDSQLRGHVAEEIAATAMGGNFRNVVIAPAFPAHGRVLRQGRLYLRGDTGYRITEHDLAGDLARCGLAPRLTADARDIAGGGVFLCDAEIDADLDAIVACGRRLSPGALWCGPAGLARALAGPAPLRACPSGSVLGVIGTRDPMTRSEIDRLQARQPDAVIPVECVDAIAASIDRAAGLLKAGVSPLLTLRLAPLPAAEASAVLRRLAEAAQTLRPATLFASGGDTLAALMDAADVSRLDAEGEVAPGLPLSRIVGGGWGGVSVVSKSGAFSAAAILARLFDPKTEARREEA
jgi:uncharacterized protein YgbK (DUF1537 family)